ncbi:MAG: NUDIX hydrolase [Hyphomonadaceae bacterium]|nr:NUDIX hydrolase [Hyphomonadaceae bacterium]
MSANEFKLNEDEKPFDPPGGDKPKGQKPRDAATLILVRNGCEVMMGQRARGHVFMPDKWVFPGGRVDPGDAKLPAARELAPETEALLKRGGVVRRRPRAFALAAVRETREEAGLHVGGAEGPDLSQLAFVARAITPPHRPRRFDARFFLAHAEAVLAHDVPEAGEELLHTKWFPLDEADALDLPSITRFVLREVRARLGGQTIDPPFLRWSRGAHTMERLCLNPLPRE